MKLVYLAGHFVNPERVAAIDSAGTVILTTGHQIYSGLGGRFVAQMLGFEVDQLDVVEENVRRHYFDRCSAGHASPKIEAIKLLRALTGCGLKDAKDKVEEWIPKWEATR